MRGKRLQQRVLFGAALIVAGLIWLGAAQAHATPLRPDVRRMLSEPTRPSQFVPARAGWRGPETARAADQQPNAALDKFSQRSTSRAVRASIVAAATPDPRIATAVLAAILLLRWARHSRGQRQQLRPQPVEATTEDVQRAA